MRSRSSHQPERTASGFSLIELVIVVVIIGIIGAIAIPRLSRGSEGAADSALRGNLVILRGAIDHYAAEHNGKYPTYETFDAEMLLYSDISGNTNATPTGAFIYGPYLRKLPPLPLGAFKGETDVTDSVGEPDHGWVYDDDTGEISANTTTEADAGGTLYNDY